MTTPAFQWWLMTKTTGGSYAPDFTSDTKGYVIPGTGSGLMAFKDNTKTGNISSIEGALNSETTGYNVLMRPCFFSSVGMTTGHTIKNVRYWWYLNESTLPDASKPLEDRVRVDSEWHWDVDYLNVYMKRHPYGRHCPLYNSHNQSISETPAEVTWGGKLTAGGWTFADWTSVTNTADDYLTGDAGFRAIENSAGLSFSAAGEWLNNRLFVSDACMLGPSGECYLFIQFDHIY